MKKFIFKILVFGILFMVLANFLSYLVLFQLKKSNFYKPQFLANGVFQKNFDYVVLGSSTGLTTLDTKIIDSITGKKGLNISLDDSSLSSHYLMLQHFYKLDKKNKSLNFSSNAVGFGNKICKNKRKRLPIFTIH